MRDLKNKVRGVRDKKEVVAGARQPNLSNMDLPSLISEDSNEDETSNSGSSRQANDPLTQSITALNEEL